MRAMYDLEKEFVTIVRDLERCSIFKRKSSLANLYKSIENLIITRINKYPEVLTIQNARGRNIGMIACDYGLERIAIKALDNKIAATQRNNEGYSIGMVAAYNRLEKVVLKALENPEAAKQVDPFGNTLVDKAKEYGIDVSKFETEKSSNQNGKEQDKFNNTISNIYDEILGK